MEVQPTWMKPHSGHHYFNYFSYHQMPSIWWSVGKRRIRRITNHDENDEHMTFKDVKILSGSYHWGNQISLAYSDQMFKKNLMVGIEQDQPIAHQSLAWDSKNWECKEALKSSLTTIDVRQTRTRNIAIQ